MALYYPGNNAFRWFWMIGRNGRPGGASRRLTGFAVADAQRRDTGLC